MGLAYAESENPANLPMAKEMLETLHAAYPNHSWWVRIDGGVVIIKHFSISGTCGMVRPFHIIAHDAQARKRDIIRAAGELLERANMKRGGYEEQAITKFDTESDVRWTRPGIIQPEVH